MRVPNIKFNENPSSGSRGDKCGQMDEHSKSHTRFSRPCERAIKICHSVGHNHIITASSSDALPHHSYRHKKIFASSEEDSVLLLQYYYQHYEAPCRFPSLVAALNNLSSVSEDVSDVHLWYRNSSEPSPPPFPANWSIKILLQGTFQPMKVTWRNKIQTDINMYRKEKAMKGERKISMGK